MGKPLTRNEQEQLIRQACVAANPEIMARSTMDLPEPIDRTESGERSFGLTDVMLTIKQSARPFSEAELMRLINCWDLCKSNLGDQTDECIATVADLLKKA